ncbi:MAG: fumarylacetoacetate hydrolase family protein [Clostridia bacterium]|nr:fumarylacetoacetate hydrolase family protein [Clostridia bacterium]
MKLVTFTHLKKTLVGALTDKYMYPLPFKTMNELIDSGNSIEALCAMAGNPIALQETKILSPIPVPKQDIICLGINYMAHAVESARYKKEAFGGERPYAVYFSKRVNECSPHNGTISSYGKIVDSLDYECELAVIIGRDCKNVKRENAFDYVFGYTILNDISARNLQTRHKQWYFGKSLDGFTPMGPCIVTEDEFERPPVLEIKSYVNSELRQNSTTDLLIFDIPHVIEELSQGMTLKAGTIISMGTPAGVGMGFKPPKFLKHGDVVECYIENIGTLRTYIE